MCHHTLSSKQSLFNRISGVAKFTHHLCRFGSSAGNYSNKDFLYENNMADIQQDDIKLTRDEAHRLNAAFRDEKFLKLFQEYVEDINSEESKKSYEDDIKSLEKERGYDVKFVHPSPCYVMKFISNDKKYFINICKNDYAGKPSSQKVNEGTEWKIPVILSKPRDDVDKKGAKCIVYDVLFHPQTIEMATKNTRFKRVVEDTALSMISENFGTSLEARNAIYPKMKYKGKAPPVVLRKKIGSSDDNISCEPLEEYWKNRIESKLVESKAPVAIKTPKYTVKYRDIIDMKDYSTLGYTDTCAPKEIVVEVILPEVKNASEVELDVYDRKLTLRSCENLSHRYQLDLDLFYAVKTDDGTAKFDKSKSKLTITLPLKDRGIPTLMKTGNDMNQCNEKITET